MLYFNSDKFDFWKLYDSIKHFYPIGIAKDESKLYYSYPGLKELENIIVDNIHDDTHFQTRWEDFTKEIENQVGRKIIGTTYGQAPSFSSFVLLDTSSLDNLTRTKELHFFVSLVGPYYTIIGQDINTVEINASYYKSTNYLVASPVNEYAEIFQFLCEKIENRFKDYRFVPFEICQQSIECLEIQYAEEHLNKVFNALFNNQVDFNASKIGDVYYKIDYWITENYIDNGYSWTAYPPK